MPRPDGHVPVRGEHYQFTLVTPEFSPASTGLGPVPVTIAAVKPAMITVAVGRATASGSQSRRPLVLAELIAAITIAAVAVVALLIAADVAVAAAADLHKIIELKRGRTEDAVKPVYGRQGSFWNAKQRDRLGTGRVGRAIIVRPDTVCIRVAGLVLERAVPSKRRWGSRTGNARLEARFFFDVADARISVLALLVGYA
jgi:hypothetical protein